MIGQLGSSQSTYSSELVDDCVYYLVIAHQSKLPIKKSDIVKHALKGNSRIANVVLDECSEALENVFGFKLVEVPEKNQFILVNKLRVKQPNLIVRSSEDHRVTGILLAVLAVVFMKNDEIKETDLWKFLSKLGFDIDDRSPINGVDLSIKELVTQRWVRQLYLKHEKVKLAEPPEYTFRWGFRAHQEVDKMSLLKFVCDIYGDNCRPENWLQQYKMATERRNNT